MPWCFKAQLRQMETKNTSSPDCVCVLKITHYFTLIQSMDVLCKASSLLLKCYIHLKTNTLENQNGLL